MIELDAIPFLKAKNFTLGRIKPIELIVLHSMEAPEKGNTARSVAHYFATTAPASAHFCVDSSQVIQCVALTDTAWQCKNANTNGIGIEHAGYAAQTADEWADDYSKAMLELSAQLAAQLCKKFDLPVGHATFASPASPRVTTKGFCLHREVPLHGSHSDPGPHFPFNWYLERVKFYFDQL